MITYKSRWLTRGEIWFDEEPGKEPLDFIVYHQRSKPLPKSKWREFHTLLVDLRQSPGELLDQMDSRTVYQINRARDKDEIACEACNPKDTGILTDFANFYDRFAKEKGLVFLDRRWLMTTAQAGVLELSRAKSPLGEVLVYQTLLRTKTRVRGLQSASFYRANPDSITRSFMGRANRLLHWEQMLRFKEQGVETYDFGGWYVGTEDQDRIRINQFKKGFGGEVVCNYDCEQIVSFKGWLGLTAARTLRQFRKSSKARAHKNENALEKNKAPEVPAAL
jgi:hypothetical protein